MRHARRWAIVLAISALTAGAAPAADEVGRVQAERVNLRSAPSTESAVVTVLDQGAEVEILSRTGSWLKVRLPGSETTGFVYEIYVRIIPAGRRSESMEPAAPKLASVARRTSRSKAGVSSDRPRFVVRAFGQASYVSFSAKQSFNAIMGSSGGGMLGGGVQARYGPVFLQLGLGRYSKSGERVFELEGKIYSLGVRDTVTVTPLTIIGGARVLRRGPIGVHVGVGIGSCSFKEASDFEDKSEGVDESFTSYHLIAGAEYRVHRFVAVGLECHYTSVPNAIGRGGASAVYEETNLGGVGVQLKLMLGK
ncbi:MAG: SH3 domain-containing protein [Vicinamibacteria bacterium]|nr:SH3 domain-containing protein [Vicinamibacteria bacterium]